MRRSLLTNLLKALLLAAVLLGLYICGYLVPSSVRLMAVLYPALTPYVGASIAYCCIVALPVFVALVPAWQIFDRIGHDESFSAANAKRFTWIHRLALLDLLLLIVGYALSRRLLPSPMLTFCFLIGGFLCLAMSVACLVLSRLVSQAAQLQQENDYTI